MPLGWSVRPNSDEVKVVTLLPGDLIFTGTPPGVGIARKPPVFLKAGDLCEVEIEGLGILRNPVAMG